MISHVYAKKEGACFSKTDVSFNTIFITKSGSVYSISCGFPYNISFSFPLFSLRCLSGDEGGTQIKNIVKIQDSSSSLLVFLNQADHKQLAQCVFLRCQQEVHC